MNDRQIDNVHVLKQKTPAKIDNIDRDWLLTKWRLPATIRSVRHSSLTFGRSVIDEVRLVVINFAWTHKRMRALDYFSYLR